MVTDHALKNLHVKKKVGLSTPPDAEEVEAEMIDSDEDEAPVPAVGISSCRGSPGGAVSGAIWAGDAPKTDKYGDLWMWLQLMWLKFEVVRGPVGVVWGSI